MIGQKRFAATREATTENIVRFEVRFGSHARRIDAVDDESGLPPIADELLRRGERRKGRVGDIPDRANVLLALALFTRRRAEAASVGVWFVQISMQFISGASPRVICIVGAIVEPPDEVVPGFRVNDELHRLAELLRGSLHVF